MASTPKVRARPPTALAPIWFIGPTMLLATVCGWILVLRGPDRAFAVAAALLLGAAMAWILVSVFWPARADRTCPACGARGLRRMDPRSTRGVSCEVCGLVDVDQSSFLFAEEEEAAIEPILVEERGGRP